MGRKVEPGGEQREAFHSTHLSGPNMTVKGVLSVIALSFRSGLSVSSCFQIVYGEAKEPSEAKIVD